MTLLFDLPPAPAVPLLGEDALFPVRRVFCVGRNYEAHAREMGDTSVRETPIWFTKAPSAVCLAGGTIPYPPGTENCHYEMELVVGIGAPGFRVSAEEAQALVLGYACGLDLTRRDLQNAAKAKGYPWDTGKDFENAAVIGPITRAGAFGAVGAQRIALRQNGAVKQEAALSDMIWSVGELIADLSSLYHVAPGDLIYTGTPAGVGPIVAGDVLEGEIAGLAGIRVEIGEAE
ncbi:fumarylpyruvate hydrolase [Novosphingobium chloroacetimidivorans]|uniref:Fumarylpyruvate hydrolase n=1 Tax=Novosphingobium chloroacetimidivorans TaxID=1428314 RepID=A0A7W7NWS9_9SPHN|nr:fumarylacetoacetate hydrolase family protein [Novosphingobium chloroacetimidivorans]MBB4858412.1 fumarylpyruvate hydrolase [Novosphingobium chloroacetimidivorans]